MNSASRRGFILAATAAVLAGCSGGARLGAAPAEPEGRLEVLDVNPQFSPKDLPESWVVEGPPDVVKNQLTVALKDGVKSLKIVNSNDGFIVVKRTKAMMLATPYLTWSWNMAPYGGGVHPLSLVVGFRGGPRNSQGALSRLGSVLPPHDRALVINWGDSALLRGTLAKPDKGASFAPVYTVRGGRENADSWWLETVDLSWLYAQLWPSDNQGSTIVSFIGVAAAGGRQSAAAHISEIKLSR